MGKFSIFCGRNLNPHTFVREILENKMIAESIQILIEIDH